MAKWAQEDVETSYNLLNNNNTYQPLYNYLRQLDFASTFYIPRGYLLVSLSFYTILNVRHITGISM
jgi:hypothetical protein